MVSSITWARTETCKDAKRAMPWDRAGVQVREGLPIRRAMLMAPEKNLGAREALRTQKAGTARP